MKIFPSTLILYLTVVIVFMSKSRKIEETNSYRSSQSKTGRIASEGARISVPYSKGMFSEALGVLDWRANRDNSRFDTYLIRTNQE